MALPTSRTKYLRSRLLAGVGLPAVFVVFLVLRYSSVEFHTSQGVTTVLRLGSAAPEQAGLGASSSTAAAGGGALPARPPPEPCSIYVLDPATEFGIPGCNYSDPFVWPFNTATPRYEATPWLKHYEGQLAAEYWVADAIARRGYNASSIDRADLVFVNLYCYDVWFLGYWWAQASNAQGRQGRKHPHQFVRQAMQTIESKVPRYRESGGRDFVTVQYFPIVFDGLRAAVFGCGRFEPFPVASERGLFCPGHQAAAEHGEGLILPYVAVTDIDLTDKPDRDIFLLFEAQCNAKHVNDTEWSIAMRLRVHFIEHLRRLSVPDVVSNCSAVFRQSGFGHSEMVRTLRRAVFCPVIAGDTQSSKRLSEVIINGCVPVFVGPPFHSLPLASDIDYLGMGVFFHLEHRPWVGNSTQDQQQLREWAPDIDLAPHWTRLEGVEGVYPALKALPAEVVAAKQAAVQRERLKFLYSPPPGQETSVLGDIIVDHLCAYAHQRKLNHTSGSASSGSSGDGGENSGGANSSVQPQRLRTR